MHRPMGKRFCQTVVTCGLLLATGSADIAPLQAQILQSFPFLSPDVPAVRPADPAPPSLALEAGLPRIAPPEAIGEGDPTEQELSLLAASAILGDQGGLLFPEMMTPVTAIRFSDGDQPARSPSAVAGLLDARKRLMAQAAWGYMEANRNPATGLVSTIAGAGQVSLWDIASTLAAIQSARDLELLSKRSYDLQVQAVLRALLKLPLSPDFGLPNRLYDTASLSPMTAEGEPGFDATSALDIGRLLVWLDIIRRRAPYFTPAIEKVVAGWRYCDLIDADGRLQFVARDRATGEQLRAPIDWTGYEQYAAKGFALWGFPVAASLAPSEATVTELLGVSLPLGSGGGGLRQLVDFDSYALDGLEFAWDRIGDLGSERGVFSDGWRAEVAHRLFQVQLRRWQSEGALTARAPHYGSDGRQFIYDSIALGQRGWQSVDITGAAQDGEAVISTRAAFALWALWDHPYGDLLFDAVADSFDMQAGFPEGLRENGLGPLSSFSLATNAGVLQALAFHLKGPAHPGASPITASALASGRSALTPALRERRCLPSAPALPLTSQLPLPARLERCEDVGGGAVANCTL